MSMVEDDIEDDDVPLRCDLCGATVDFPSDEVHCDHCDQAGCGRCVYIEDDCAGYECAGCRS